MIVVVFTHTGVQYSTVYVEIIKDYKIHVFHCKLAEHEVLILIKKKQWLKETMYST